MYFSRGNPVVYYGDEQGFTGAGGDQDARQTLFASRVQDYLDEVNSNHAKVAQIKKFKILDHDLSQETGELTPTLKVKRNVVNDKYAELFDSMYG